MNRTNFLSRDFNIASRDVSIRMELKGETGAFRAYRCFCLPMIYSPVGEQIYHQKIASLADI